MPAHRACDHVPQCTLHPARYRLVEAYEWAREAGYPPGSVQMALLADAEQAWEHAKQAAYARHHPAQADTAGNLTGSASTPQGATRIAVPAQASDRPGPSRPAGPPRRP